MANAHRREHSKSELATNIPAEDAMANQSPGAYTEDSSTQHMPPNNTPNQFDTPTANTPSTRRGITGRSHPPTR